VDKIFRDLVEERAFLDRVLVGVWGKPRKSYGPSVAVIGNRGIAGPRSQYARLGFGRCRMSGNPFQWAWGKYQKTVWTHLLPPFRFSIRSESVPITWAQLNNCVDSILLRGSRQRVTLVEVTFDTHLALDTAERDLFTSARTFQGRVGWRGRRTVYIGSARSAWQLRMYQKTRRIVRFEFILRAPALRKFGVNRPQDLLLLRTADLWRFVRWREFVRPMSAAIAIGSKVSGYRLAACMEIWHRCPRDFEQILRTEYRIDTQPLLGMSLVEKTLRRMQAKLIW